MEISRECTVFYGNFAIIKYQRECKLGYSANKVMVLIFPDFTEFVENSSEKNIKCWKTCIFCEFREIRKHRDPYLICIKVTRKVLTFQQNVEKTWIFCEFREIRKHQYHYLTCIKVARKLLTFQQKKHKMLKKHDFFCEFREIRKNRARDLYLH